MVKIKERRAEKLSGLTSLFISFDYNENIINFIKQNIDLYNFNKKTKEWEVLTNQLSKILDSLCFLDDIELNLYKEEENKIENTSTLVFKTRCH